MERKIRLGELLLRAGLITELQLNAALAEQKKWGGRLGHVLVEMNFISEDLLVKGLSKLLGVPLADLAHVDLPQSILDRFDPTDCQNRGFLPIAYSAADKKLTVAFVDVNNVVLVDELRFKYGFSIVPHLAGESDLQRAIRATFYGESFDTGVTGQEPGLKLVNNAGSTLIKHRSEIFGDEPSAAAPVSTGVERVPARALVDLRSPAFDPQKELELLLQEQKRQSKAIKTLLDLLMEKGMFSRGEFMDTVNRRVDR